LIAVCDECHARLHDNPDENENSEKMGQRPSLRRVPMGE